MLAYTERCSDWLFFDPIQLLRPNVDLGQGLEFLPLRKEKESFIFLFFFKYRSKSQRGKIQKDENEFSENAFIILLPLSKFKLRMV